MLLAGLFDEARGTGGESLESFSIVTTSSNDTMADLHDRMPVILDDDGLATWLDRDLTEFGPLEHLLQPAPDDAIEIHRVSPEVNNARHNGPGLIEPIDD
jgi:putative SOS response-associated peptidase YedK